ncbi:MAG: tetratricopeptide (TPR) repeat protein [Verrucomicrobiales bacterium]
MLSLELKDYSKALELCETAIRLYPKAPFGFVNKSFALHETNQTEKSLQVLEESHLIVAVEPVAIYNRGCYLACLDRNSEAVFWVSKAIRLSPALYPAALKDPDLEAIRARLERDDQ